MPFPRDVTEDELRAAIPEGDVRGLMILQLALGMGLVSFGVVIAVIALQRASIPAATPQALETMKLFSAVNALLFVADAAAATFLWNLRLARLAPDPEAPSVKSPERTQAVAGAVQYTFGEIRASTILRNALLEGPSLFGLVTIFMAVQNGVLDAHPVLALNALPAMITLMMFVGTLPSAERYVQLFKGLAAR